MIMFYVNYVYTFVFKKVWDQFNESISSDIILKVIIKILELNQPIDYTPKYTFKR
jgi:hypothetical protein